MPTELASLPTEVLIQTLGHLPLPALLAFGQTSRYHRELQHVAFVRLRIGVFPTRITSLLSLLESTTPSSAGEESTSHYDPNLASSIHLTLPRGQHKTKDTVIRKQNQLITQVLSQHGRQLRSLEVSLWELERQTADAVAGCRHLRHLAIRLDHPHTRHKEVQPQYWKYAAPSTVWNALYIPTGRTPPPSPSREIGNPFETLAALPTPPRSRSQSPGTVQEPLFPRLESLTLDRAGITDYQLSRLLIGCKDTLRVLRLRKCVNLTAEFWRWLARSELAGRLRVLHFTHSRNEEIDESILEYVGEFEGLEVSLHTRG
jgi:hypothetical protein